MVLLSFCLGLPTKETNDDLWILTTRIAKPKLINDTKPIIDWLAIVRLDRVFEK